MLSLKMFERLAIVVIILALLFVGMGASGMFRPAKGAETISSYPQITYELSVSQAELRKMKKQLEALSETSPPNYIPSYPINMQFVDGRSDRPHSLVIAFSPTGRGMTIDGYNSKKSCELSGIQLTADTKKDGWKVYYYCVAKDN